MIQRGILDSDRKLLGQWLAKDEHHQDTTPDFFFAPNTVCNIYSDEIGPVFFMRGEPMWSDTKKIIRLDIQFDNDENKRNARMLVEVDRVFCVQAKTAGFSELFFESNSPKLIQFCERILGFKQIDGVLRKNL